MPRKRYVEAEGDGAVRYEPLAYDILESCRLDGTSRSTKYKALNSDPEKRDGLPYLPSFTVGRRRLIMASDHREWLEKLRAATLGPGTHRAAADDRRSRAAAS